MNIFVLALLIATVSGKPQYNYPVPSRGAISPGGNGRPSTNSIESSFPSQSGGYNYNQPSINGNKGKGPIPPFSPNEQGGDFSGGQAGSQNQFYNNQPAIIQKNVYVHIPPPELEENQDSPAPLPVGPPEKNYKIIFIKAPAPKQAQLPLIPPQPPKEEKTLVYVLVKKPEEASQLVIPTPEPTQPSKPEVFFIRYKPVTEVVGPDGGIPQGTDGQAPGYQNGGQIGGPPSQTGGQGVQGYPSQQTGNQGASYLPPDNRKLAKGGSY